MSANLATGNLVSKVKYYIELPPVNGQPGGNFQLKQLKTMDITDGDGAEVITNGAGNMGKVYSSGGTTFTGEVHRQGGIPNEVDWIGLKTAGPENTPVDFVMTMQDVNGTRFSWSDTSVAKADLKGANDGNQTMAIELITAADVIQIQPAVA